MPVPTNGWMNGGLNKQLNSFRLLARMLGLNESSISSDDLQGLFSKVANAKLFAENVQAFMDAAGGSKASIQDRLENIEAKLGLMQPLPFMSLRGQSAPSDFEGIVIWPAGTTLWTQLRLEQIQTAVAAGAHFTRVVCLGSSRKCTAPADLRHPFIASQPEGTELTERELQMALLEASGTIQAVNFSFPDLPDINDAGRPLSLEQQLSYLRDSGQLDQLVGNADIYVPANPNALYVPLHVRRVLGRDNVWFSQAGARLVRGTPDYWWPSLQDVMTTPNGIIRLWVELLYAGCITT